MSEHKKTKQKDPKRQEAARKGYEKHMQKLKEDILKMVAAIVAMVLVMVAAMVVMVLAIVTAMVAMVLGMVLHKQLLRICMELEQLLY